MAQPGVADGASSNTDAERAAFYRLVNNEGFAVEDLLAAHFVSTASRARCEDDVLVIGDTSECPFNTRHAAKGLGPLGGKYSLGMLAHATYAVTSDGLPLGVLDAQFLVRDAATLRRKHDPRRHQVPLENRESRKWNSTLESAERLRHAVGAKPRITVVLDREGDIARLIDRAATAQEDYALLVRVQHNRKEVTGTRVCTRLLETPARAKFDLVVPAAPGRSARVAHMSLRFAPAQLENTRVKGPRGTPRAPQCNVWVVIARELCPPSGVEPLDWRLYSTRPIVNVKQARRALEDYAARWSIEVLFRTWKSVMRTLERQYRDAEALKTSLMLDLILAFVVLHVTHLRRSRPQAPAALGFDPEEIDALRRLRREPKSRAPPTLAQMCDAVADLGGHVGRKTPAGPLVMARGLHTLAIITATVIAIDG